MKIGSIHGVRFDVVNDWCEYYKFGLPLDEGILTQLRGALLVEVCQVLGVR